MKKRNKVMATALAMVIGVGSLSFAYFTDRAEGSFESKSGTMCLNKVHSDHDLSNMAPGDEREITYEYENTGSLAIDTRVTYIMNYRSDSKVPEGTKIAMLLDGDGEILALTAEGNNKKTVERATIKGTKQDVGLDSLKEVLKFKFAPENANVLQDARFTIDVIVEGKQNKNDAEWAEMNTVSYVINGNEVKVVETSACNAKEEELELFTYSKVEGGYAIAGYNQDYLDENNDGNRYLEIEIPESHEGERVVEVAERAFSRDKFTSIDLGKVEVINDNAFGFAVVEELEIPNTVKVIGDGAFYSSKLTELAIPSSVETIESEAFYSSPLKTLVLGENVKKIGSKAFMSAKIKELTLPDKLETIGSNAFWSVSGGTVNAKQVGNDKYPTLRDYNFGSWTFNDLDPVKVPSFKFTVNGQDKDGVDIEIVKKLEYKIVASHDSEDVSSLAVKVGGQDYSFVDGVLKIENINDVNIEGIPDGTNLEIHITKAVGPMKPYTLPKKPTIVVSKDGQDILINVKQSGWALPNT